MSRWRVLIIGALVVFVGMWVVLGLRHHQRTNEWAHGGDHVRVQAAITTTDAAEFGAALAAAGGSADGAIIDAQQGFVVTVTWTGTSKPDGYYQFVLLDDRVSPAQLVRASSGWSGGKGDGPNWAGAYEALHQHYSWLAGTAEKQLPDGSYTEDTDALGVPAEPRGSATLAYWIDKDAIPTADAAHDLRLAMFLVDADGEVRWARRIPLNAAR